MVTFIREAVLNRSKVPELGEFPFNLPAIRNLDRLALDSSVTFFVGENGSGKSTLVEAIAIAAGFNPEGGSANMHFATQHSESPLHQYIQLIRSHRRRSTGFFLRAEGFFNVASLLDQLAEEDGPRALRPYGGKSLHQQSHGESFLSLVLHRFGPNGLYILDEPEAALSPKGVLTLIARIHDLVAAGSQFIISTHSPMLLGYPGSRIYSISHESIVQVEYEETDHFRVTRDFLNNPKVFLRHLFEGEGDE